MRLGAWQCGFLAMANATAIELWRQFAHVTVALQLKEPLNWFPWGRLKSTKSRDYLPKYL